MCSCVMSLKLGTSLSINGSVDGLTDGVEVFSKLLIDLVEHTFADLDAVGHLENFVDAFNSKITSVVLLTTRGGVETALVKDNQVSFVLFKLVSEDSNALALEVHLFVVVEVDVTGLRQVNGVVENLLGCLHDLLLASGDLVIEVARGGGA